MTEESPREPIQIGKPPLPDAPASVCRMRLHLESGATIDIEGSPQSVLAVLRRPHDVLIGVNADTNEVELVPVCRIVRATIPRNP